MQSLKPHQPFYQLFFTGNDPVVLLQIKLKPFQSAYHRIGGDFFREFDLLPVFIEVDQ
ncbi:hypothetical protein OGS89_RS05920 [Escherichia coli]|uniref:hypothetical protein n=1 Tax=Escherichia coli TaxID=562 RepID=UPI00287967FD|nr:hypothetical protein [Escherichia coli]MDS1512396.1 hypothetical protein [Escherichia coli]MDS1720545.1 hypothetical protein [Escherichia coli]